MKLKFILLSAIACLCLLRSNVRAAATQVPETSAPVSSIEDPSEAAAATSSDFESDSTAAGDQDDSDFCLRCYDKIRVVQDMIAIQTALQDKQKKLVHRKSKAAAEAAAAAAAATRTNSASGDNENTNNNRASRLNRRFNNNNTNQTSGSTVRSRTLQSSDSTIVVSTLRVARSPAANSNNKLAGNKKDPDLKRLKQEQQQQLNATCKMLLSVQACLEELSQECIGNLQFHSLEVYSNQWHTKLYCHSRENPGMRVFPGLRLYHNQDEAENQRKPIARPISSNEEVRNRLHDMFPNGFARPFGVMLKPTLTNSASLRYGQIMATQQQQQQQQQKQQEGNKQQLRDFSGHLNQQHYSQHPNSHHQVGLGNDLYVGKILLVPCCFAIIVALVALVSFYYWRPIDDVDQLKVSSQ